MKYLLPHQINKRFIEKIISDFKEQNRNAFFQIDSINSFYEMNKIKSLLSKYGIEKKQISSSKYTDRKKTVSVKNIIKLNTGRIPNTDSYRININLNK